ncbi:ATP-binding protein [Cytobacillus praedii]|uniref:ATP-binding protein n=1 Tax=Cytobacillus praedii TaxID=1742358 RepID=UPI0007101E77|nr:ATP-binding protein [Cytobacillus praedii]
MKKARSLKKELIYSFLSIAFFSIAILGVFQIYQLSSLTKENQRYQAQTAKYLADYIDNYILDYKKAIQTEALNVKEPFLNNDIPGIQKQLKDIKTNYPGFVNMYVGDSKGQSIVFYPESYTDGVKRKNHNFSDRYYYKELLKTKDTVISPVYHGRGGTDILLVAIVSPILNDQGELVGYVLGALDLNALGEHIKNRTFGDGGYAVVIDQENNVVVHPEVDTRRELVNLTKSAIVQYIEKQQNKSGSSFFETDKLHLDVYVTYEKINNLNWTVWVSKPTEAITSTYKNAILVIIVFLLITATIMVLVSLFLTDRLERTIRYLLNYIKDYTKGIKEETSVTKKIQGPQEMGELFYYFNHMIDEVEKNRTELIELNKELEARVEERTTTLKNKNLELKAVNKLITSVSSNKDLAHFIQHCLKEIAPFMEYSIHVFFHDLAVTTNTIHAKQNLLQYLSKNIVGDQQYIEPIQIEKNNKGFLIVDLMNKQSMTTSQQEFLRTFASSLAVMLQNKFLFEQIRNKHAVLAAVLESMSEGLMLVNNQKEVEYVNEFFLSTFKIGKEKELVSFNDVYRQFINIFGVDPEELSAFFANKKKELKLEYRAQQKKPKYYILHKFSVMLDEDEIGEGLLLRDITKEEEIDTLKNNLISLTSHEFKTPITNIKGSVETLLRPEVEWEPDFQKELLEGVHEDIERILHLVNDWMDISKIESGTMYVERNVVRACYLIEKSMEQIPLNLRTDASFHFHNKLGEDFSFYADKIRVQQVLVNLMTNALRYNDSSLKTIDITLDKTEDYITIAVSDNGIGISEDHISKIFNHFYQVDVTATRRTGGTGLGLAICVGIMEAHEGKIEAISESGKGSTFILYFPNKRGRDIDEKSKDLYR